MAILAVHELPRVRVSRASRGPITSSLLLIADPWLAATLVAAIFASLISWFIAFQTHTILLYRDTHSHLDIARRVVDASSTGLAQLGGVWLPLPHLVMLPFIWNDYLWRSGLAGSFPSMIAYVITAVFLYRTAFRLTSDQRASFLGALVFILNPNILYLQATPLSELVLIASMTAACYYFITWAKEDNPRHLIFAAVCTFLAALARYDGWALFLVCLTLIAIIGWRRKTPRRVVQGNLFLYGLPGALGIGLWLLWNLVIFHDPLYFQHSQYSAQDQQKFFISNHLDWTYHNLWQAIHDYLVVALETVGPLLFVVALAGLIAFCFRSKLSPEMLASLAFLVPLPFYIAAMFSGQAIVFAPGAASSAVHDVW
ncbi:MAG: glycosyltransferase family 39 protein, partial [Candidatus Saccharimonadales bacterium]